MVSAHREAHYDVPDRKERARLHLAPEPEAPQAACPVTSVEMLQGPLAHPLTHFPDEHRAGPVTLTGRNTQWVREEHK